MSTETFQTLFDTLEELICVRMKNPDAHIDELTIRLDCGCFYAVEEGKLAADSFCFSHREGGPSA